MKNIYQKIIAFLYLSSLIIFSFLAPIKTIRVGDLWSKKNGNYSLMPPNEYGSIWEYQVDGVKFGYILLLITVFYLIIFLLLKDKK